MKVVFLQETEIMDFGICLLSVIPVRKDPSDKSEMTSQLLFGDLVAVETTKNPWLLIRSVFDGYEGWVDIKQIYPLEESEFRRLNSLPSFVIPELIEVAEDEDLNRPFPLLIGSTIRGIENSKFKVGGRNFSYSGSITNGNESTNFRFIAEHAFLFLNAPYMWGGKTPFGIDCSGLVQVVFNLAGIGLLRDASKQATMGEPVSLFGETHPGDLIFFDNDEGQIVHVGILLENNQIIHASGKVRIDPVDHNGIYNRELKKYSHNLRLIRRII